MSSVSLNLSLKTFEDIKAWSNHTCLRCGTKDKELNKVMVVYARGRDDIGNLMPLCGECASKVTNDYQGVDRPDYRAKFATAHNLPWPKEFGPSPADKAAEKAENLIAQLPPKPRSWVVGKMDQIHLILPVIESLFKKGLNEVANPVGYLVNGLKKQLKEAAA
ncbi:MAG: hypothetical protein HQK60_13975 [Deltaproteobacteria bacterium]|nr:hypothetical protein [Deltaproteobacteria bacterium]